VAILISQMKQISSELSERILTVSRDSVKRFRAQTLRSNEMLICLIGRAVFPDEKLCPASRVCTSYKDIAACFCKRILYSGLDSLILKIRQADFLLV
jgi:hypothetical protein